MWKWNFLPSKFSKPLISAGLQPVLSLTENKKFNFTICGKLSIIRCDDFRLIKYWQSMIWIHLMNFFNKKSSQQVSFSQACHCYSKVPNIWYSGFLRDKTMDDKLMYMPNDNKQNYHLVGKVWTQLVWTNQSRFDKNPKSI